MTKTPFAGNYRYQKQSGFVFVSHLNIYLPTMDDNNSLSLNAVAPVDVKAVVSTNVYR